MNNSGASQDPKVDRQLADFTDAVLDGKETDPSFVNSELVELQETVRQIQAAVKAVRPDQGVTSRIRKRLLIEWKNSSAPKTFFWQQPRLILTTGIAAVVLVAAGLLLSPGTGQLTGAATDTPSSLLLLASITVLVFIIYWLVRQSRRH